MIRTINQLLQNYYSDWTQKHVEHPWNKIFKICEKQQLGTHYENTPIQIYRKFHLQKLKIFR